MCVCTRELCSVWWECSAAGVLQFLSFFPPFFCFKVPLRSFERVWCCLKQALRISGLALICSCSLSLYFLVVHSVSHSLFLLQLIRTRCHFTFNLTDSISSTCVSYVFFRPTQKSRKLLEPVRWSFATPCDLLTGQRNLHIRTDTRSKSEPRGVWCAL